MILYCCIGCPPLEMHGSATIKKNVNARIHCQTKILIRWDGEFFGSRRFQSLRLESGFCKCQVSYGCQESDS